MGAHTIVALQKVISHSDQYSNTASDTNPATPITATTQPTASNNDNDNTSTSNQKQQRQSPSPLAHPLQQQQSPPNHRPPSQASRYSGASLATQSHPNHHQFYQQQAIRFPSPAPPAQFVYPTHTANTAPSGHLIYHHNPETLPLAHALHHHHHHHHHQQHPHPHPHPHQQQQQQPNNATVHPGGYFVSLGPQPAFYTEHPAAHHYPAAHLLAAIPAAAAAAPVSHQQYHSSNYQYSNLSNQAASTTNPNIAQNAQPPERVVASGSSASSSSAASSSSSSVSSSSSTKSESEARAPISDEMAAPDDRPDDQTAATGEPTNGEGTCETWMPPAYQQQQAATAATAAIFHHHPAATAYYLTPAPSTLGFLLMSAYPLVPQAAAPALASYAPDYLMQHHQYQQQQHLAPHGDGYHHGFYTHTMQPALQSLQAMQSVPPAHCLHQPHTMAAYGVPATMAVSQLKAGYNLISLLPIDAQPTRTRQAYGMDKVWLDEFECLFSQFVSNVVWTLLEVETNPSLRNSSRLIAYSGRYIVSAQETTNGGSCSSSRDICCAVCEHAASSGARPESASASDSVSSHHRSDSLEPINSGGGGRGGGGLKPGQQSVERREEDTVSSSVSDAGELGDAEREDESDDVSGLGSAEEPSASGSEHSSGGGGGDPAETHTGDRDESPHCERTADDEPSDKEPAEDGDDSTTEEDAHERTGIRQKKVVGAATTSTAAAAIAEIDCSDDSGAQVDSTSGSSHNDEPMTPPATGTNSETSRGTSATRSTPAPQHDGVNGGAGDDDDDDGHGGASGAAGGNPASPGGQQQHSNHHHQKQQHHHHHHHYHHQQQRREFPKRFRMFIDSAKVRFCCDHCGHGWTSMKGRVVFWYEMFEIVGCNPSAVFNRAAAAAAAASADPNMAAAAAGTSGGPGKLIGYCAYKLFGQQCDVCKIENRFERPMWYPEEVTKVLNNLYNKIGQVYFGFKMPAIDKQRRAGKPKTSHNSSLCQACHDGVCTDRK